MSSEYPVCHTWKYISRYLYNASTMFLYAEHMCRDEWVDMRIWVRVMMSVKGKFTVDVKGVNELCRTSLRWVCRASLRWM